MLVQTLSRFLRKATTIGKDNNPLHISFKLKYLSEVKLVLLKQDRQLII